SSSKRGASSESKATPPFFELLLWQLAQYWFSTGSTVLRKLAALSGSAATAGQDATVVTSTAKIPPNRPVRKVDAARQACLHVQSSNQFRILALRQRLSRRISRCHPLIGIQARGLVNHRGSLRASGVASPSSPHHDQWGPWLSIPAAYPAG